MSGQIAAADDVKTWNEALANPGIGAGPYTLSAVLQFADRVPSLGSAGQAVWCSVNLGRALGARNLWNPSAGAILWRRDCSNGFVPVNEPGAAAQTVTSPARILDAGGNRVRIEVLNAK